MAADSNSALGLQVVQKGRDKWSVNFLQRKLGGGLVQTLFGKLEPQPESVAIGTNGVRADLPLPYQALEEEPFQQGGKTRRFYGGSSQCFFKRLTTVPTDP